MKKIRVLFLFFSHCLRSLFSQTPAAKAQALHQTAKKLIAALEIKITTAIDPTTLDRSLWICNHTGFWDIIVLSSIRPVRFITSEEMRRKPVLGWICKISGCFFMDRSNPHRLRSELKALMKELEAGTPLVLFPEGTTSDGSGILEFKRGLLQFIKKPLAALVMTYDRVGSASFTRQHADALFYFGDRSFLGQAMNVFGFDPLSIRVEGLALENRQYEPEELHRTMLERYRKHSAWL